MNEAVLTLKNVTVHVRPRETWCWDDFQRFSPPKSIALDGMVRGGPCFDEPSRRVNFDHHDGVVREATMSTAMQVYFAIKGGLMDLFSPAHVFINDTDQDTAFAVWLLEHHKMFAGAASIPHVGRLLALTDRWDITGGAFPMNLDDAIVEEYNWVFDAYTDFRKSGALARATPSEMARNLEATLARLDKFSVGEGQRLPLDTRCDVVQTLLVRGVPVLLTEEIGGNAARYLLYNRGMQAFVARVASRPDGRRVYSVGRRSRFVDFDVKKVMARLSDAEPQPAPWGGSDIIGGSNREYGSGLTFTDIVRVLEAV